MHDAVRHQHQVCYQNSELHHKLAVHTEVVSAMSMQSPVDARGQVSLEGNGPCSWQLHKEAV